MRPRYLRIFACFARNGIIREMTFRGNFLINVASEILWISMLLIFFKIIYLNTQQIRGWTAYQYLFLLGTHMAIASLFETFFFENCHRVSELIRTGNLDFVLLKPADTQFLLSVERMNYASLPNLAVAIALCAYARAQLPTNVVAAHVLLFIVLIVSGVITLYSLMFMFTTTSVWFIRQTGMDSLWFYLTSFARYPAEIYRPFAGGVLWFAMTFIIPVLIVANLPANVMARTFDYRIVIFALAMSAALFLLSALVFRWAMRWYRSASS